MPSLRLAGCSKLRREVVAWSIRRACFARIRIAGHERETPAVASPPAKTQAVPTLRRRGDRLPDTHVRAGRLVGTCAPFGPKMQRTGGAQACVGLVSRQRVD